MMVAWTNQFLIAGFGNISYLLCATVAYLHIIPIEICSKAENADLSIELTSLQRL